MDDQTLCVGPFFYLSISVCRAFAWVHTTAEARLFFASKEHNAMRKLLTLEEMSQATHRSPKALRVLMSRGKFPFVKIGGRIFGDPDEIDRFLKLSRKTTAEEAAGQEAA
jgi:hypothetical protein